MDIQILFNKQKMLLNSARRLQKGNMTDTKRLTEAEARRFLELLQKVEADIEQAAYGDSPDDFDDKSDYGSYEEKWGATRGQLATEEMRGKLRNFVEHAYLQEDDEDWDVEIADEIEDEAAKATKEAGLAENRQEALEELRTRVAKNVEAGKPMLQPPVNEDEIERIESEKLRALAWDLDAIARAYNYATDPTLPDLSREKSDTWLTDKEELRLEEACSLLKEVYDRIYRRVGEDLQQHSAGE